ncbi:MAG: response regulator [bacterium]|nr:response regulator [bacterium]
MNSKLGEAIENSIDSLLGIHVLVVEDNLLNQIVFKKNLTQMKATVSLAGNGLEALKVIENDNFDIILMDLQMPLMNGFEATRKIRQLLTQKSNIPIIAISADLHPQIMEKAIDSGMNDYLPKHCENSLLKERIKFHITNFEQCIDC